MSGNKPLPRGAHVLDRLVAERRLSSDDHRRVVSHAQAASERIEEALIATGVMSEAEALKYVAALYRTRFVSSERLARADVEQTVIELVPRKLAERLLVFPIKMDRKTGTLSVVAADLQAFDVAKQVQVVSGAKNVSVYVARPAAIRAAVRKFYYGDVRAFATLQQAEPGSAQSGTRRPSPKRVNPDRGSSSLLRDGIDVGVADFRGPSPSPESSMATSWQGSAESTCGVADYGSGGDLSVQTVADVENASSQTAPRHAPKEVTIRAPELAAKLAATGAAAVDGPIARDRLTRRSIKLSTTGPIGIPAKQGTVESDAFLETLNVMVTLLEHGRGHLRGHSALVARLCRKICERVRLSPEDQHGVLVAAYLHDIGKASTFHLTPLNVAHDDKHRAQAKKNHLAPIRLFDSAKLAEATTGALRHLYERFDGGGFPDRLANKDIPLGARILAVVETYADITTHDKNPFRARLDARQALEVLNRYRSKVFDGVIVDVLKQLVLGDDLRSRLLEVKKTVLLVDPDPEETTVLEMRLIEQGYDVLIARTAEEGLEQARNSDVDVLISEVELSPFDGFELLDKLRGRGKSLPVVLLTRKGDRESVHRGFELGAADYLIKPASPEVVVAKTSQIVEKQGASRSRGVSGSIGEMSIPDVIQILANGHKSGQLSIRSPAGDGELYFHEGRIVDASFGKKMAEEAVYAILLIDDGEFALNPEGRPKQRTIQHAVETLLLEGMRRMDEQPNQSS